ncbi:MAG: ATP-binding cassette domain-containing protein [Coriobacteriia bacterium]|nr:ATP-binding cassette domain-containing protein [Coriobacteriia bacterium]
MDSISAERDTAPATAIALAGQPIVKLVGLSKTYRQRKVIDSFSLTVNDGEFVAIMGKSGSGKSTLLNIIGLLDKPDTGSTVEIFGKPAPKPGSASARSLLRDHIGYLFQNAALIDQDSVEQNLATAQRFAHTSKEARKAERMSALATVGLAGMDKQKVYELSGGEQQRLAVACLLVQPCELILADEPTGSLDAENRDAVLELLHALRDQGKTVIVVSHDPVVAVSADRIVPLGY